MLCRASQRSDYTVFRNQWWTIPPCSLYDYDMVTQCTLTRLLSGPQYSMIQTLMRWGENLHLLTFTFFADGLLLLSSSQIFFEPQSLVVALRWWDHNLFANIDTFGSLGEFDDMGE